MPRSAEERIKIRVAIVDDHEIVLQGLRRVLAAEPDMEVVAEASDAREAIERISASKPDVAILDLELPGSNGILLMRELLQNHPKTKVIIFSAHISTQYIREAVNAGVSGYLGKIHKSGEIPLAVRTVQTGQLYLCAEAATALAKEYRKKSNADGSLLSSREQDVLKKIAEGRSTKEIAGELHVSVKTVESHRQKLMEKLEVHSVAELTKYAIRQGITRI